MKDTDEIVPEVMEALEVWRKSDKSFGVSLPQGPPPDPSTLEKAAEELKEIKLQKSRNDEKIKKWVRDILKADVERIDGGAISIKPDNLGVTLDILDKLGAKPSDDSDKLTEWLSQAVNLKE